MTTSRLSDRCPYCGRAEGEEHASGCAYKGRPLPELPLNIVIQLPPEVRQYAPDIRRFLDAMIYKLGKNAHKGRWESRAPEENLALLQKEVEELREAQQRGNMVEVMLEAADVANFALIAAAIAVEKK